MDIIINPTSGSGKAKKTLQQVENFLKEQNIAYVVHNTFARGDATSIAKKLCESGVQKIAAIGGDGTFHEVLNGMDFSVSRLGFIPSGRGNDFAATAKIPFDPIEAVKKIIRGTPLDLDFIKVGDKRCLNVCGTGLDIEVLKLMETSKNKISYATSLVKCLLNYKPYEISVELNGETKNYKCIVVAICNGNQYGDGMKICPPAKIDDGLLHLMIVEKPKKLPALLVMPEFMKGKHLGKSYATCISCERVKIVTKEQINLDGEIYDEHELDASIVKGGLKTFA